MTATRIIALLLIAAGILGLVYHSISYTKDEHDAKIGSVELSVRHKATIDVPTWLGAGAIVLGAALLFGSRSR
jgi:hypothetical protein